MKVSRVQTLILLFIPFFLSVCNAYGQKPPDEAQKITATLVQSKPATITQQYVCEIQSRHHIEVRAPAEGYLSAIAIREGQTVKKGDVMFELGPILFKARLDAESAERDIAQLELNNAKKLAERQGVSELELRMFEAKLAKAQAKVGLALAELNFTKIKAPFDGMVGRLPRQGGSFVLKGETLTTLSDNSVMRVYFNVPENRYLEYMAGVGKSKEDPNVELVLANQSKFPQTGKIDAIDTVFDKKTGNIAFRADFPNPDGLLRQGQTGNVLIKRVLNDAIIIPQRATLEALDKRYVYVIDEGGVAHRREIVIQNELDEQFVVRRGVAAGDKIVLDGVRLVHDGDKVEN